MNPWLVFSSIYGITATETLSSRTPAFILSFLSFVSGWLFLKSLTCDCVAFALRLCVCVALFVCCQCILYPFLAYFCQPVNRRAAQKSTMSKKGERLNRTEYSVRSDLRSVEIRLIHPPLFSYFFVVCQTRKNNDRLITFISYCFFPSYQHSNDSLHKNDE